MTLRQALDFIRYHGVVLEGAKGLEPSIAVKVAGEEISGSWWAHPQSHEIYEISRKIRHSRAVLVCTLARGKITFIHRRLWPFFVRVAGEFPKNALDKVEEIHTSNGHHERQDVPFPDWVPADVATVSRSIRLSKARKNVSIWLSRYGAT